MKNLILFLFFVFSISVWAQPDLEKTLTEYNNPEELVTLSENIPFNQALQILSSISERMTGKKIVSTVSITNPIGVQLDRIQYKKALNIIVQFAGLMSEEGKDVIVVKNMAEEEQKIHDTKFYADINEREVKISAVIFEADMGESRERGINWSWLLQSKKNAFGGDFKTFTEIQQDDEESSSSNQTKQQEMTLNLGGATTFDVGDYTGTITGLFKFFEEENLGEIIASPTINVRNTQKGRIQIGSDFSIKQRDFSGNITDKFFSTGSIIEVTPYIFEEEGMNYVLLDLLVDRSSAIPSEISTEIKRTSATTQVLMLNNEETVIGGLFVNEESVERTGIPFLKDLPWWVLGIRYLTGSDSKVIRKKEVVISIKIEILPSLRERLSAESENKIQKELEKFRERAKYLKSNSSPIQKGN